MSTPVRGRGAGRSAGRDPDRVRSVRGRSVRDRSARVPGRRRPARRRSTTRRTAIRRRWVVALVFLGLLGLGYAVIYTPLLGVGTVEVVGVKDLTQDEVRAAAAIESGTPMARLDTDGVRTRIAALPRVASVTVTRSMPGTVRLAVVERTPVGVLKAADGAHLVDGTGKDFATVPQPPPGLPELQLPKAAPGDPVTRAVVGVLAAVPDKVRPEVLAVTAKSAADVRLALSAGREVRWGSTDKSPRKAEVLQALLTVDGKVFDVTSPELPTVS
ncbi:FtsQ-type POTRA domain-containing protein [Solihabitans fulvus]|uniref:Cell division protein FtsQ n=1 Tax=Solihabitans fulvus TaxID=1892852 RepID=A0A5B2X5Y4_9PSEU|nr:FtsQ-type POTRA domain-containing protein [Solihabitans fulvus]KAA2258654.1 FtsQ-type POTRA domain-containing protein [Solihabitans fulvus]